MIPPKTLPQYRYDRNLRTYLLSDIPLEASKRLQVLLMKERYSLLVRQNQIENHAESQVELGLDIIQQFAYPDKQSFLAELLGFEQP